MTVFLLFEGKQLVEVFINMESAMSYLRRHVDAQVKASFSDKDDEVSDTIVFDVDREERWYGYYKKVI